MTSESLLVTTHFENINSTDIDRINALLLKNYNFDINIYAPTFINRRVIYFMQKQKISDVNELLNRLKSKYFFEQFLFELSTNGIEFFRDTSVWENLLSLITSYCNFKRNINIWFPDCANGEDLYSLTILLKQFGFYDKCKITASNISNEKITFIKQGKYEGKNENVDLANYSNLGFATPFTKYFKTIDTAIQLDKELLTNVTFIVSNVLQEMESKDFDLVFFRNTMITYNKEYQIATIENIFNSMRTGGLLIIGIKEQLLNTDAENKFKLINVEDRIFLKN